MMDDTVTIGKEEYEDMLLDSKILAALMAGGVDSWEGYDTSLEGMNE